MNYGRPHASLAAALAVLVMLPACVGGDDDVFTAERADVRDGGTLHLALEAMPSTFNPWAAPVGDTIDTVLEPTHGSAVALADDGSWTVDERYASAVEVQSADPLVVAVTLNPEAVWSDGSSIDAADMQAFAAAQVGAAGQVPAHDARWSSVAGVDPGADEWSYTVRFTVPTPDWPALIYPGLPAEATTADAYNGFTDAAPPANGPFVVAEIDRAAGRVRLARNPQWWGPQPALSAIEYRVIDPAAQAEAFADGDLDALEIAPAGIDDATDNGAKVSVAPGNEWSQLTMNAARGPLASSVVRQAVALAVDRGSVVKAAGSKAETAGSLVRVPGQDGYTDTAGEVLHRDTEQARSLLVSAGYVESGDGWTGADGAPLTLRLPVPEGNASAKTRADSIAGDLAEIGIQVTVEPRPAAAFFTEVVVPLDFDLVTFLWSADPFDTTGAVARVQPVDSPLNFTGLADPAVAAAAQALVRASTDPTAFAAAAVAFDTAVLNTFVVVPLAVEPRALMLGDDVVNLVARRFGSPDWTTVGFRA
ncbi:MAG: ABC transporter substrate-binding protein [Aeromicrobium sp.]|uniref:ABC transporter substrate-binding protein n=1 Tax=Aeromicrobium sp. TaxID=1871063 RepID=UPI0039E5E895